MESLSGEELPVRPLLLAAGAAATAFSIYCFIKLGDGQKRPERQDNKTSSTDPVREQAPEPALVGPTEVLQDQVTEGAIEAEQNFQKHVVFITHLENILGELEELLREARSGCNMNIKVSEAEAKEKHQKSVENITQLEEEKPDLTKEVETLSDTVKECEREQEPHSVLQVENDELKNSLIHEILLLKVSVAEAEEKNQKSVETITYLEEEKSDLTKQLKTLSDNVEEMRHLLQKHNMESANLTKVCVQEWEELVKVSVAEAEEKHQKDVETITQLKEEKSDLNKQVETLRDTVKECERERETHSVLQAENHDMMKTLIHEKLLLKVSVAEAEEKHQKDVETIDQLKEEKSDLTKQMETLRDTVKECEREREAHSVLQAENDKIMKTLVHEKELMKLSVVEAEEKHQKAVKTITQLEEEKSDLTKQLETLRDTVKECEREREAQSILQAENDDMMKTLIQQKEIIKVTVAEAEEKHQRSVETITQLEEEKSDLTKELEILRDTVKEFEREREARSVLQTENNELKRSLIHEKLLLKVSVAETEEKHQKFVETITQLEEEKSDLTKQVETLTDTVKECEREREAHSVLQTENNELKQSLIHEKLLLKVSVAEAEEKQQKSVETIAQLEEEKSDLTKEVETLRDTVKECEREQRDDHQRESILQAENDKMIKTLVHEKEVVKVSMVEAEKKHQMAMETIAHLEKEKSDLTKQVETMKDAEREGEAHSILQAETDKMLKTLFQEKELLKVSVAEAEEKHQKSVETIAQLNKEKSDLTKQVERLKDIGHLLIDRNVKFANLTKIFEQEREELMKVSLAKGEEKHQKDVETIAQLEEEKSDLTKQVERLRDILGNDLFESLGECDEQNNDQEHEAHSVLQLEYDELKNTVTHKEKLLKVSLAEAEEKHQKALETVTQLEEEKSDLSEKVETLRKTVQDMGNDLYETHRECDRLTDELAHKQEACRNLQSECHEMKKTHEDMSKDN